jgi:hypothetical protein
MALSFEAAGRVLKHVGRLMLLRADLAAEELALARQQWIAWICVALAGVALLAVALAAAGAWLTLLLWDRFGAGTAGVLALVFAVAGGLLLRGLVRAAEKTPAALPRTRAALHEDYEGLAGAVAPQREADRRE